MNCGAVRMGGSGSVDGRGECGCEGGTVRMGVDSTDGGGEGGGESCAGAGWVVWMGGVDKSKEQKEAKPRVWHAVKKQCTIDVSHNTRTIHTPPTTDHKPKRRNLPSPHHGSVTPHHGSHERRQPSNLCEWEG